MNNNSRSENSVKNSFFAIGGQMISLVFGFITRIYFVRCFGAEYLGLDSLFNSLIYLLSFTELGFGSALTFALYKPIADKDEEKIGKILNLYARVYYIVAGLVTVLGLCIIPFLGAITKDVSHIDNIVLIYIIFLVTSASSYFFSYKRALVTASESDYKNSVNQSVFAIIQNILQLVLIILVSNQTISSFWYIIYLIINLVCQFVSNIFISRTASKMFPFLKNVKGLPDKESMQAIVKNVKALVVNRVGSIIVVNTDNLLINAINTVLVGIYSNYWMIIKTLQMLLDKVIAAVTASLGNLIAGDEEEKKLPVYRNIMLAVSWIYGFVAIALDLLLTRFIIIAFPENMEMYEMAVHFLCINFYLNGLRQPNYMFINAAGLFKPIKWKGCVEAAINLGASILLLCIMPTAELKLLGIIIGTTISQLATSIWWEPFCVSKHCIGKQSLTYYVLDNIKYIVVIMLSWTACYFPMKLIPKTVIGFLLCCVYVAVVPNLIFLLCYARSKQFGFFKTVCVGILKKLKIKH